MDHETSVKVRAAERYARGEVWPPEREAFEEHFFECPECAAKVRGELAFEPNLRAELRENPPASREKRARVRGSGNVAARRAPRR